MPTRNRLYLVIVLVAALVVTGSVVRFLRQRSLRALGSGLRIEEAVAFKFGRLIKERLPGHGAVLIVRLPPPDACTAARAKRQLAAFVRGLDAPAQSVIVVSPPQLPAAAFMELGGRMYRGQWSKELLAWIAPHPEARAVVSFMGFPEDLPEDSSQRVPPLLAVYAGQNRPAADWVEQGKAFALAELRSDAALQIEPTSKASVEEIFNANYRLVMTP